MSSATLNQPTTETLDIAITRVVSASPENVFDAWLCADHLSKWWGPSDGGRHWTTPHVKTDPKPGGEYRICIRSPRGEDIWARGVYRKIERPLHLLFTHVWENDHDKLGRDRLVSVSFGAAKGGTRVTFTISGFSSSEVRDGEIEGWNECLTRLVEYFDKTRQTLNDEAEIRATIDAWSQALEAKSPDGLAANCAPDILLFDIKPPYQVKGVEAYRATWQQCLPYFPARLKSERRDMNIVVDGDVAFMHCMHHTKPLDDQNHPAGLTWIRVTACYRRIEGKWKAVHEHVSVPFDPRSGQVSFIANVE